MSADESAVRAAAEAVVDPVLRLELGTMGAVREVALRRSRAGVTLALPVADYPGADDLAVAVSAAVEALDGVKGADVVTVAMTEEERFPLRQVLRGEPLEGGVSQYDDDHGHGHSHGGQLGHESGRPNRFMLPRSKTRVIGISSGKGGVGKSSVTVNLGVALARAGYDVGILDADVYGFSVPGMLGITDAPLILDDLVIPLLAHGVRALSIGFFVPEDAPVIWRGPMLHKALEQFLVDAYWGEPDFLLVDMPPGTGDVTLSLGQYLSKTEVYVVTTPQPAAQRVAQRSAIASRTLKLAVRGVVENMSWFTGDDGTRYELFGRGGGAKLADDLDVPLLGQIPLVPDLREGGDVGVPVTVADPDGEPAAAFTALAEALVALGPARVYRSELSVR